MERLTAKRKAKLLEEFGENVRPISQKQKEWCLRDTARYIWFENKDFNHGKCERCGSEVEFEKRTRHKTEVICPKCKHKMEVRHHWRASITWNVDFRVMIKTINDHKILMRYILIDQHNNGSKVVQEVAREVMDFKKEDRRELEYINGEWKLSSNEYFRERHMWQYRRYCCLQADPYRPGFASELKKLDRIKYLENPIEYEATSWYVTSFIRNLYKKANLYEKLEKVGLHDMAIEDFKERLNSYSSRTIKYKTEETSLKKMLGLNNYNYKRFMNSKSTEVLEWVQNYPTISDDDLEFVIKNKVDSYEYRRLVKLNVGNVSKMLRYTGSINIHEYVHYVGLLKSLGYKMTDYYLYPKDFRKADRKVTDEYNAKQDAERVKETAKQSELIRQISYGLRAMPDLQEFLGGSNGLLVYVPETAEELIKAGRELHNCIGTYVDRVAKMETMVFFVRRLNALNEPFVAFEYCHGKVLQCRYDHNKVVEDVKILSFVDAFAEKLKMNNILVA